MMETSSLSLPEPRDGDEYDVSRGAGQRPAQAGIMNIHYSIFKPGINDVFP